MKLSEKILLDKIGEEAIRKAAELKSAGKKLEPSEVVTVEKCVERLNILLRFGK